MARFDGVRSEQDRMRADRIERPRRAGVVGLRPWGRETAFNPDDTWKKAMVDTAEKNRIASPADSSPAAPRDFLASAGLGLE